MNKPHCPKIGIKIHKTNNEYKTNPFVSNQLPSELCNTNKFDLNIDNYSMSDIFNLFNIQSELLNE